MVCLKGECLCQFLHCSLNPMFNNMVLFNFTIWAKSSKNMHFALQMDVFHRVVWTFFLFFLFYDKLEFKLLYGYLCWLVYIRSTYNTCDKSILVKFCTLIVRTNYNFYKYNIQIIHCAIVCVQIICTFVFVQFIIWTFIFVQSIICTNW